jgi:hypothetical protein
VFHYIYGLHLEGDNEIRYVGSTLEPLKRLWAHLNELEDTRNKAKNAWVRDNRPRIRMTVLEAIDGDYKAVEKSYIIKLRKEGHRLFNIRRPRRSTQKERQAAVMGWLDVLDKPSF